MDAFVLCFLIGSPLLGSAICLCCRSPRGVIRVACTGVLVSGAAAAVATSRVHSAGSIFAARDWFFLDPLSAYHLVIMMLVFGLSSLCLPSYFDDDLRRGALSLKRARRFGALWLGALAAMTLVLISNNIGILWVGIEATTLVTAFLIAIHRTAASLEAMWKYLIICSVGIAFAFMGTLLVGAAAEKLDLPTSHALLWTTLTANARHLDPSLLKAAFLFLLVGYGTKAGLAPMHTWLPDAHSQAPAPVSAIFSGFMLNAALYAIMRYVPLVEAATGHSGWSLRLLLFFGLFSIMVAAAFIIFQHDVKRLLAYHSVEHLGIIAVGLGLGGLGTFAALFHTLNHSVCKTLAFLSAGRLGQIYGSHDMSKISGTMQAAPVWGKGLFVSLLALIGVAPFAIFLSEFLILQAAFQSKAYWTIGLFLAGAGIVFVGALQHAVHVTWGTPRNDLPPERASIADRTAIAFSLGLLLVLGLWMPDMLQTALEHAAHIVEGNP